MGPPAGQIRSEAWAADGRAPRRPEALGRPAAPRPRPSRPYRRSRHRSKASTATGSVG
jgi:hypothetical protein